MAKLTKKEVQHIADLSNLTLTDEEIAKFTPQLDKIIEFIATLSEVDTTNVEPTSQTTGLTNVLREDEIKVDNMLTPETDYYKVPSILQNRS